MATEVDGITVYWYAEFEKDQEEELMEVNEGDNIVLRGTFSSGWWNDCRLLDVL